MEKYKIQALVAGGGCLRNYNTKLYSTPGLTHSCNFSALIADHRSTGERLKEMHATEIQQILGKELVGIAVYGQTELWCFVTGRD